MNTLKMFAAQAVLLAVCISALADVPKLINYQGRLTSTAGVPVANATYTVTFTIYDAATGGTNLWSETNSVITSSGLFAVLLGNNAALPNGLFSDTNRYVGIQVSTDPELIPRQRLVSAPYSYRVSTVDGASGGIISGNTSIQSDLTVSGNVQTTGFKMPTGAGSNKVLISDAGGVGSWQNLTPAPRYISHASGILEDGIDVGPVASRTVTFIKNQSDSKLRITYSDNFRVTGDNKSSTWEIKLDGASISNPNALKIAIYNNNPGVNIHRTSTLVGYVLGVSAGTHTIRVDVGPTPGYSAVDAYTGWSSSFLLEVEEIP